MRAQLRPLETALAALDALDGAPCGLSHPDLVPSNVVMGDGGELCVVDWAVAGVAPRVAALGWLLWVAGERRIGLVDVVLKAYAGIVRLERREVEGKWLESAIGARALAIKAWEVGVGRVEGEGIEEWVGEWKIKVDKIVERVTEVVKRMRDRENQREKN
jgi:aminoglycoside phosphotransferase (APT) family kinase protein